MLLCYYDLRVSSANDTNWISKKAGRNYQWYQINKLRPRKNGRHVEDDIFKCIFLNEKV